MKTRTCYSCMDLDYGFQCSMCSKTLRHPVEYGVVQEMAKLLRDLVNADSERDLSEFVGRVKNALRSFDKEHTEDLP